MSESWREQRGMERGKSDAKCARETELRGPHGTEVKTECARQREGNFVQNCSPGRGERQAGVQRSVQEAGGLLCVPGAGEGEGREGPGEGGRVVRGAAGGGI